MTMAGVKHLALVIVASVAIGAGIPGGILWWQVAGPGRFARYDTPALVAALQRNGVDFSAPGSEAPGFGSAPGGADARWYTTRAVLTFAQRRDLDAWLHWWGLTTAHNGWRLYQRANALVLVWGLEAALPAALDRLR